MELEALKRACAADLEDEDAALALVCAEIRRRFSEGDTDIWLERLLRDLAEDVWQILDAADFDWYEAGYEYGMFPLDSGEIWGATATNLLTFCDFDWGCDHLSVMDFGGGVAFLAFDSNTQRGLDDYEIEGEIDLLDLGAVRELARDHLQLALSIGDHLGRCPADIMFASPVTGDDIRSTVVGLFVSSVPTAEEYAEWMNEKGHGVWPFSTEDERAALADAYLEVALGYPPTEYAVELSLDEGSGVLLSDLLESGQADLDRISNELDAVSDQLANRDAPETDQ
jgi:hypothetical protein